jgi:uncharacterized protein (DUF362 family)
MNSPTCKVRAAHCDYRADSDTVYEALCRATRPLTDTWDRLKHADRIAVKFNQESPPEQVVLYKGQRQQLVCDNVVRGVLRMLRENTTAEIFCADISLHASYFGRSLEETSTISGLLSEFGVEYVDGTRVPTCICPTPRGGTMFRRYTMMQDVVDADVLVSVAKAKSHFFAGITGCLKNLFGVLPHEPAGRPRTYYHHFVRLPYALTDIAMTLDPQLNIVDALVGQAGMEWGEGRDAARVMNTIIAGNQVTATDACLMHLMGDDPGADWDTPPFHRARNALAIAHENGFGTADLSDIDFESEVAPQPPGTFFCRLIDPRETNLSWIRTTSEQALYYRDHRRLFEKYRGEYILLQDGEVRWHSPDGALERSRRELSGSSPDHAMWFKFVDPDEAEGEHYEVYEDALARLEQ